MTKDSWVFYYDESMISPFLTEHTFMAPNFYNGFVTCIVGWKKSKETEIFRKYADLIKFLKECPTDELKSDYFKPKDFWYGFNSVSKHKIKFLLSFLKLIDSDDVFCQIVVENKISNLIACVLEPYMQIPGVNYVAMVYSVSNLILTYKPQKVIEALTSENAEFFMREFLLFVQTLLNRPDMSLDHMSSEKNMLEQIYSVFTYCDCDLVQDSAYRWDYSGPFLYLSRKLKSLRYDVDMINIDGCFDESGQNSVFNDACCIFDRSLLCMVDSKKSYGIQIADMFAGILSKLIVSLNRETGYGRQIQDVVVRYLSCEWFQISKCQDCYMTLKHIFDSKYRPNSYYFDINYFTLGCFLSFISGDFDFANATVNFNRYVNSCMAYVFSRMPNNEMLGEPYNWVVICKLLAESMDYPCLTLDCYENLALFAAKYKANIDGLIFIDKYTGNLISIECAFEDIIMAVHAVIVTEKCYPVDFVFVDLLTGDLNLVVSFSMGRLALGRYKYDGNRLEYIGEE